jgi:hypothetical protein
MTVSKEVPSIIGVYQTGMAACEVIVVIAVTLFAMKKLFSTGVLSKFDEEDQGGI